MRPSASLFDETALIVAALVMILGALAPQIRRRVGSLPLLALLVGAALGPLLHVSQLPASEQSSILYDLSSLALAAGLFGSALKLPPWDVIHHWRALALLVGLVMPLMWFTGGMLTYLALELPLATALLIGACVAPTDPVLARTIALGRLSRENVPDRVAHTLLGESSVNDGAALILVVLMAVLLPQGGTTLHEWFTTTVLWAVGGALPLGFLLGWLGARFERLVFGLSGETPPLVGIAFPLSLAILSLMLLRTLHVDGVLGVFVSGLAFNAFREKEDRQSEEELQDIVDDLFGVIIFFVFGLALPWDAWTALGWRLAPLVVGILVLRRLPWMLALSTLLRPQIRGVREVAFAGWFGPIGVSALFYATLLADDGVSRSVWPVVAAVVTASVLAFGVTGAPLTRWLGRHEVPAREEG